MNNTMFSTRHAIPVIILLVLALIPTFIHSYIGARVQDGKSVDRISVTLDSFSSVVSKKNKGWGEEIFYSDDWFERIYTDGISNKVRLFVGRSYDHKRLYHHPELALSYGQNFTQKMTAKIPGQLEVPIQIHTNSDNSMFIAYALLYDNGFVENPILHQLKDSLRILVNARKPMTLFYVSETRPANNQIPLDQSAAISILNLAIQSFRSQTNIKKD